MMEQQQKRGRGAPRKGKEIRLKVTRSFSPELLRALESVTNDQSDFIEKWMWQHPLIVEWLRIEKYGQD
jgi:hypothetical protein